MIPLPDHDLFVDRVWRAGIGPAVVALRDGRLVDITTRDAPTTRDLLEWQDIAGFVAAIDGEDIGSLDEIAAGSREASGDTTRLLVPCDLRAVKACGVTFARSMLERVIEEQAGVAAGVSTRPRPEGGIDAQNFHGRGDRSVRPSPVTARHVARVVVLRIPAARSDRR